MNKQHKYLDILIVFFVTALLTSNLLSSAKIVDLNATFFGLDLIFDAGLILFPFCYIIADIITEVYGFKNSRRMIWLGFIASIFLSIAVKLAGALPSESDWLESVGEGSYENILLGLSSGGILLASLTAYLLGEFTNSIILTKLKVKMDGKQFWFRSLLSTVFGQFVDTTIFVVIATFFGVFKSDILLSLILTNYIFKLLIEVVFFPCTQYLTLFLKRKESIDVYDKKISFNPFAF